MKFQSEMKAEMERFAREKKELTEQIQDVESQLDWHRAERDEEITKLTADKRSLQDRLHDAEVQLAQLKSRKRDELKVTYFLSFSYAEKVGLFVSLLVDYSYVKKDFQ